MPLTGAGCKLGWGEAFKARVRTLGVVVDPPCLDDLARLLEAGEEMLVEALIAQAPVEALDEAVLHRLARRDVVPFDMALLLPVQDGVRGQLGAVVAHDHRWIAALDCDAIELPSHAHAGERVVGNEAETFPAEVVDQSQDAEATAVTGRRQA